MNDGLAGWLRSGIYTVCGAGIPYGFFLMATGRWGLGVLFAALGALVIAITTWITLFVMEKERDGRWRDRGA